MCDDVMSRDMWRHPEVLLAVFLCLCQTLLICCKFQHERADQWAVGMCTLKLSVHQNLASFCCGEYQGPFKSSLIIVNINITMTIRLLTLCNTVKWGALPARILIIRCRVAVSNSYSFKLWLAMTSHVLWRHVIRCHVLRRHVVAVLCSFQHYDDFHILMIWLSSCMRSWGIHPRLTIFMFHILISVLTFTVMAVVLKIQTSILVTPNPKIYL